jgi:hypothetical protein
MRAVTPSLIAVDGIDWRFADPQADALAGFNVDALTAAPLARNLIGQLGGTLKEADLKKIFDGLSSVSQVALSVHDNRVVILMTGRIAESPVLAPEAGLKATQISGTAMLFGHADAVDQASQRIVAKGPLSELARWAGELQVDGEFWAVGSARLMGPQAVSTGVKRFSLTVSIGERFTSDLAFEFNGAPNAKTLQEVKTALPSATIEGNVAHVKNSMEAEEVQRSFSQMVASPLGQQLSALVNATRYLPAPDTSAPKPARPVIYGLDDGPKVVKQNQ